MSLQDLTPQLRTRLNRLERVVGLFVCAAGLLLLTGLVFYGREQARRKGWFDRKLPYFTFARSGAGLKIGDKIRLMGFEAGEITEIQPQPPEDTYANVFVAFVVKEPYDGYLWSDSRAKVLPGDFLGGRYIELTKGTNGYPSYLFWPLREVTPAELRALGKPTAYVLGQEIFQGTDLVAKPFSPLTEERLQLATTAGLNAITIIDQNDPRSKQPTAIWDDKLGRYIPVTKQSKGYFTLPSEALALNERLEEILNTVEIALPDILMLTNHVTRLLGRAEQTAGNVDATLAAIRPILTNTAQLTAMLNSGPGALGEWLLPTNVHAQLVETLAAAHGTLTVASNTVSVAQTNVERLSAELATSLEHLAGITSNLNAQVQANSFILSEISSLVTVTDEMVQGLKRHWLLKSAFAPATNGLPPASVRPTLGLDRP